MTPTLPDHDVFPAPANYSPGLSKREYFAAKIMAGFAAHATMIDVVSGDVTFIAESAVQWANALIAALSRVANRESPSWTESRRSEGVT